MIKWLLGLAGVALLVFQPAQNFVLSAITQLTPNSIKILAVALIGMAIWMD